MSHFGTKLKMTSIQKGEKMNKNILYNNLVFDPDEIDCIFHALIKNYIT